MFYKNTSNIIPKIDYKVMDFSNFSSRFSTKEEKNSYIPKLCANFTVEDGALKKSYGEDDVRLYRTSESDYYIVPEIASQGSVLSIFYFVGSKTSDSSPQKQLIFVTSDYKICFLILDSGDIHHYEFCSLTSGSSFRLLSCAYQDMNYLVITTKHNDTIVNYISKGASDFINEFSSDFYIYDICNYNNKMFVVLDEDGRNKILFGDDINPLNLLSSVPNMQSINVSPKTGKILKLLSYNDYLYVVCEYGIYRIVSYSSQKHLVLEDVYKGNSKIIENSIVIGGDNIIFADEKGIYIFNGNTVSKVDIKFSNFFEGKKKHNSVACFSDNKYYFATRLNYSDGIADNYSGTKNNCLIVYDIYSKEVEFCPDMCIKKIIPFQDGNSERVLAIAGGLSQRLRVIDKTGKYNMNSYSKKIWESNKFNLDKPYNKKIIRNFRIKTSEDVVVTIFTNDGNYEYNVAGSEQEQKIITNIQAQEFSFKVVSVTENPSIETLKFLVGVYE